MMRPFDPRKVPRPPDFRPLPLNAAQPLDIEIGCGVGFHPLRYARAHPDRQLVAFERTREKFEKFRRRLACHEPLPNLFAVHGDAVAWITHGIPEAAVDRCFLLYPNPYPKESQRNLRFHHMPFFAQLRTCLKPGAELVLATNEAFYASEARDAFVSVWGMELVEDTLVSPAAEPRTHFEKKYLARGETCRTLVFRRTR